MLPGARFTLNLFYQYELILPKLAASVQPGGIVTYVKLYILEGSLFLARIFWSAPIPVAEWSKERVCSMDVCCECCVFSGRGLCDGPIPRPEESYRLCCVIVCDQM
jgi:hypothetical protein